MEEGLRLDNLTKNPLPVSSRFQIPSNGSLVLTQSEYLSITDGIVELAEFGKLNYCFIPVDKREMPKKANLKVEKRRDLIPVHPSGSALVKNKPRKD